MTDKPVLSNRLSAVYSAVPDCRTLIDVGTDHGYIPVSCILGGKAKKAVAADIREGPLVFAKRNADRFGVSDRIEFRQTNGLKGIPIIEDDCVVISGFGGLEMISVLSDAGTVRCPLILQPQRSAFELRTYLDCNGYTIGNEIFVKDRGKYYSVIECSYTGDTGKLSKLEAYAGKGIGSGSVSADHIDHLVQVTKKNMRSAPELESVFMELIRLLNRQTEET